jgi:hypothetical protein
MPLLFSYGTLQRPDVQMATFGRRLAGEEDALPGWEPALLLIDDPAVAARLGTTHHANARFTGDDHQRVQGMAFEVTEPELDRVDAYEAAFAYARVEVRLASGRDAWVYVGRR